MFILQLRHKRNKSLIVFKGNNSIFSKTLLYPEIRMAASASAAATPEGRRKHNAGDAEDQRRLVNVKTPVDVDGTQVLISVGR
ncbi:unnamed protein product [Strongylus vulgaris]|uniref:Uncharacterized protein n=1 Tax=Strongylus vulgaris TaxID=40348 RepID=A0A3P7IZX5_STRVU|nr:unnamed protein product [Strongylus vulgaris]